MPQFVTTRTGDVLNVAQIRSFVDEADDGRYLTAISTDHVGLGEVSVHDIETLTLPTAIVPNMQPDVRLFIVGLDEQDEPFTEERAIVAWRIADGMCHPLSIDADDDNEVVFIVDHGVYMRPNELSYDSREHAIAQAKVEIIDERRFREEHRRRETARKAVREMTPPSMPSMAVDEDPS